VSNAKVVDSFSVTMGDQICAVVVLKAEESTELSRDPSYRKESCM